MGWEFHDAREAFGRCAKQWDEINKAQGNHILLDSLFVGPLVRCFAPPGALLGISDDPKYPGMTLVTKEQAGFWQTFQPAQGPLGLIVLANAESVEEQIQILTRSLPGYALGFGVSQQDPDHSVFRNLPQSQKLETLPYIQMARLILNGAFDEYWMGLGRYYVDDLRRQRRRLSEQGAEPVLVADEDPSNVSKCVGEYSKLEETGWKGKEGTAVTANNQQGLFYQMILENFCRQGEGIVYRLLLKGETIASNLCVKRDGMIIVLKIAYDERLKGISPGKLIHQDMLRILFSERKIQVLEWYGHAHEWQRRLGGEVRTTYHVNFYRHEWVSAMRRSLKRTLQFFGKAIEHEHRNSPS